MKKNNNSNDEPNKNISKSDKLIVKIAQFSQNKQELRTRSALGLLDEERQYFDRIKNIMV